MTKFIPLRFFFLIFMMSTEDFEDLVNEWNDILIIIINHWNVI